MSLKVNSTIDWDKFKFPQIPSGIKATFSEFNQKLNGFPLWEIILVIFLALPVAYQLIKPGYFFIYDDMHIIRLQQLHQCILDGQFLCRWVPDLGFGYGYPLFIYYAPLPYYFMEIFHLLGFSFLTSIKIGFLSGFIFGGIFFYFLSRKFFSRFTSFLTTTLYLYAPFKAAEIFVRGGMSQLWGMASLPLLLLGFESFLAKQSRKNFVFFSLAIFVFLITHNLTVLLSFPLLLLWGILRIWQTSPRPPFFKKFILAGLTGTAMSGFFILPVIFDRGLVHLETLTYGYFQYFNHFLSLDQIFTSLRWGYGPSEVGTSDLQFLGLGPLHSLALLLSVPAILFNQSKDKKFPLALIALSLFCLFMSHFRSAPVWRTFSFLHIIQFPWRFILIVVFISCFLFGYLVDYLRSFKKYLVLLLTLSALAILYLNYFQPKNRIFISDKEKLSGESYRKQVTASIWDYLPRTALYAPKKPAPAQAFLQQGEGEVTNYQKGTDWFKLTVQIDSDTALLVIPAFDYPRWQLYLDGQKAQHQTFGDLGLVAVNLDQGVHQLSLKFKNNLSRQAGDILSLTGLLALVGITYLNGKNSPEEQ